MKRTLIIFSCFLLSLFSINAHSQANPDSITSFLRTFQPQDFSLISSSIRPRIVQSFSKSNGFDRSRFSLALSGNLALEQQKAKSNTYMTVFVNESIDRGEVNDIKGGNENFINHDIDISATRDYYFKENMFLSAAVNLSNGLDRTLINDWDYRARTDLSIPLGIGIGRPYNISQAWRALTIINDLECNGIAADRSQTKDLADLMVMQRYRRIFDGRLNRIQRKTELHQFMIDNQFAEFTPFSAAVLEDTYSFEYFRQRMQGLRFFVGLQPGVFRTNTLTETSEIAVTEYSLRPMMTLDYFLPISEDWQFDIRSTLELKTLVNKDINSNVKAMASAVLAWIPNARIRSEVGLIYGGNYSEFFHFTSLNLGYNLIYYFSPRLTMNVSANFGTSQFGMPDDLDTEFSERFEMRFTYWLL